ncbi:hypothetical protein Vretimale_7643 [Volvox reticuliferus]|uniref:Uncharacterized protein n=1 Tax=Volvox reticuliferus TaxID=1737510 RepID=A0A8J4FNP0_9CHLO|nr:hypothetical protein Vretifemale_7733 [Volvox reticuliferus]GIM02802.1 hypothetical protein Vretimale_7643 [Volvox reticuliferus]
MSILGAARLQASRFGQCSNWPQGHPLGGSFGCSRSTRRKAPRIHIGHHSYTHEASLQSRLCSRNFSAVKLHCGCKVPAPGASRAAAVVVRSSSSATEAVSRQLSQEEESTWKASCDVLASSLGLDADESSQLVARAFGWTTQAFWRQEKVEELPTPTQVENALEVLQVDLAMTSEEAARVVRLFPELLACDVEGRLRANIAQLGSLWRLKGPTLTKAVIRQPAVLGYSVDCSGDCIGECNRCWARF